MPSEINRFIGLARNTFPQSDVARLNLITAEDILVNTSGAPETHFDIDTRTSIHPMSQIQYDNYMARRAAAREKGSKGAGGGAEGKGSGKGKGKGDKGKGKGDNGKGDKGKGKGKRK